MYLSAIKISSFFLSVSFVYLFVCWLHQVAFGILMTMDQTCGPCVGRYKLTCSRAVSSGPAPALGVVSDTLLTPLSQNSTRWFLTHPVTRPSSEGCLVV